MTEVLDIETGKEELDIFKDEIAMTDSTNEKYLGDIGPSVDDQAVSLSDDGTTIIIDFFSFLFFSLFLPPFNSSHSPLAF